MDKEVADDMLLILTWIVMTKYEGLMHIPPRNEVIEQTKNVKLKLDGCGSFLWIQHD